MSEKISLDSSGFLFLLFSKKRKISWLLFPHALT